MRRKIKKVSKLVNQLVDPNPQYVSIVGHGANQTPFNVVKSEVADLRGLDSDEKLRQADNSSVKNNAQTTGEIAMPNEAEVYKIELSKSRFDSVDTASQYLEAKGYTDFSVADGTEAFTVIAKDEASFEGEIKAIKIDEGVTFYIGRLAANQEGLDMTTTTKSEKEVQAFKVGELTTEALTQKYDYMAANLSSGKTIAEVMADAKDGFVPGLWELNDAFYNALRNCVMEDDTAGVKKLASEYGDLIVRVMDAVKSAGNGSTAMKEALMSEDKAKKSDETANTETTTETAPETPKTEAAPATETPAPAEEPKAEEAPAPAPEAEQAAKAAETDIASVIAKAVADAVSPLKASVDSLAATVSEVQKGTSEGLADVRKQVGEAGERVAALEGARQTRKSADVADVGTGTEPVKVVKTEDDKFAERCLRNSLGFMSRA